MFLHMASYMSQGKSEYRQFSVTHCKMKKTCGVIRVVKHCRKNPISHKFGVVLQSSTTCPTSTAVSKYQRQSLPTAIPLFLLVSFLPSLSDSLEVWEEATHYPIPAVTYLNTHTHTADSISLLSRYYIYFITWRVALWDMGTDCICGKPWWAPYHSDWNTTVGIKTPTTDWPRTCKQLIECQNKSM